MTEAPRQAIADSAPPRLSVHGRYGADLGFALEGASPRGLYLRRLPASTSFYAEDDAVWLCWNDASNRTLLQVLARVRQGDNAGLRLQFEPGQAPGLIEQVQALVPKRSLAQAPGTSPVERAITLIVDVLRGDFVAAVGNLLDRVVKDLDDKEPTAVAVVHEIGAANAAKQLRAQREELLHEFRRRLTAPWRRLAQGTPTVRREQSAMQVMGEGEMRAWVSGREAASALAHAFQAAWRPLRVLLQQLLEDRPGLGADALSVAAVVDALAQSAHATSLEVSLQELILRVAGKVDGLDLGTRYQQLAIALGRIGIRSEAPAINDGQAAARALPGVTGPAAVGASQTLAAAASTVLASNASSGQVAAPLAPPDAEQAWSALRRVGTLAARAAPSAATAPAIGDEVLQRAAAELLAGRAPVRAAEFRKRLQQQAESKSGTWAAALEPRQLQAIDLVARVHEALNDDPLLPAGFKDRCRPLLQPILTGELHGEGLSESGTPLRRLLSLVEFGSALCAGRDDPTAGRIRDTIDEELGKLTQTLPWSSAQLDATCVRLEQLLQRQRMASEASEKRVIDTCEAQQRIADARAQVQHALTTRFAGRKLPQALVELLHRRLATAMLPIMLRAGPEGAEWLQTLRHLEQLHRALQHAAVGRTVPLQTVADHLKWLRSACAGPPDEQLLAPLIDSIERGVQGEAMRWVVYAEAPAAEAGAAPAASASHADAALTALNVGTWLSMEVPGRAPRLLKLAWHAADHSRYVFVNRIGQKSEEIDAAALRQSLADRTAQIIDAGDTDIAERAWRRMLISRHDELAEQATRDPLTGLLDRRELERRLQGWLITTDREPLLLLWLGVDHLRMVNQSHGMAAGDHLLRAVAESLNLSLHDKPQTSAFAARVAGDEFVVVLKSLPPAEAEQLAITLFERANALDTMHGGRRLRPSLSMGMVAADPQSATIERLLGDAERACDAAKESGRGRWYRHQADDSRLNLMRESAEWVRQLDESLQSRGLLLYGQRATWLSATTSGEGDYIEVLLRMPTADGIAAPGDFILAAERYGQIEAVDRYVVQELTRTLQRLATPCSALIAFNISARNIVDSDFIDEVIETLRRQPLPLHQLCVELTETAAIQQIDAASMGMRKLADSGLKLVLDDFGSGWSSYQYLRRLPFDVVKVDGAFIRDITRSAQDHALASSINEIAHLLGKRTVAEHVEDQPTLDAVRGIGFDFAQGYHLGRPIPLPELLGL